MQVLTKFHCPKFKTFVLAGFLIKGAYKSFKNLVMVLRNLMESLLRRLQDVIDGQATILSTSQKLYT
jgi:hypothetical protein